MLNKVNKIISHSNIYQLKKRYIQIQSKPIAKRKPLPSPIEISNDAIARLKTILIKQKKDPTKYGLAVSVKTKGCAGKGYKMGIELISERKKKGDDIVKKDNVSVMIEKHSLFSLIGSKLIYKESLLKSGLDWENPNVLSSCGCGSSFFTKK